MDKVGKIRLRPPVLHSPRSGSGLCNISWKVEVQWKACHGKSNLAAFFRIKLPAKPAPRLPREGRERNS